MTEAWSETRYVNVYRESDGRFTFGEANYPTREAAEAGRSGDGDLIAHAERTGMAGPPVWAGVATATIRFQP